MKILLPIKIQATGGTSSFAQKLKKGLAERGHQVTFSYQPDYDLLLASPRAPVRYLVDARRRHKPIVHRLDGVYYPATVAGRLYWLRNLPLSITRKYFADAIIYQSQYSQDLCRKFLLTTNSKLPNTIIHNGVDTSHFTPDGPVEKLRSNPNQHIIITWSRFRRDDQIDPVVAAFNQYRKRHQQNSKLVIIGNFEKKVSNRPQRYRSPHIKFYGVITRQDLPRYARGADIFLMTHQNPPCPNNVIEAMACGLPICGLDDGAMSELVATGINGELLPTAGDGLQHTRRINPKTLADIILKVLKHQQPYAAASRARTVDLFSLSSMLDSYLADFNSLIA